MLGQFVLPVDLFASRLVGLIELVVLLVQFVALEPVVRLGLVAWLEPVVRLGLVAWLEPVVRLGLVAWLEPVVRLEPVVPAIELAEHSIVLV